MELLASTIAVVFGSKTVGKSDLLCGRNQLLPYIIVLYMIAENITVVITLAPCSDKCDLSRENVPYSIRSNARYVNG